MTITRYINISIDEAILCVNDKDKLEAYALAIVIKNNFSSSCLKLDSSTITGLMALLSVGHGRAIRTVKNALDLGFIRRDGKRYVANKIYDVSDLVVKHKVEGKMTLKDAVRFVRKVVLLHKLNQVHYYNDLKNRVRENIRKKNVGNAKRMVQKEGLVLVLDRNAQSKYEFDLTTKASISMVALSNQIGMSVPSTRGLLNELIESGYISKEENLELITESKNEVDTIVKSRKHLHDGHKLICRNGRIYRQLSNVYTILSLLSIHYIIQ